MENYISTLKLSDSDAFLSDGSTVLYADLTDIPPEVLNDIKSFASELFTRLEPKNLPPLAEMLLKQKFDFYTNKGEDLISGIISSVCSLAGKPVRLVLCNTDAVRESSAFNSFLSLLKEKYEGRESFPTFDSVIIIDKL